MVPDTRARIPEALVQAGTRDPLVYRNGGVPVFDLLAPGADRAVYQGGEPSFDRYLVAGEGVLPGGRAYVCPSRGSSKKSRTLFGFSVPPVTPS